MAKGALPGVVFHPKGLGVLVAAKAILRMLRFQGGSGLPMGNQFPHAHLFSRREPLGEDYNIPGVCDDRYSDGLNSQYIGDEDPAIGRLEDLAIALAENRNFGTERLGNQLPINSRYVGCLVNLGFQVYINASPDIEQAAGSLSALRPAVITNLPRREGTIYYLVGPEGKRGVTDQKHERDPETRLSL